MLIVSANRRVTMGEPLDRGLDDMFIVWEAKKRLRSNKIYPIYSWFHIQSCCYDTGYTRCYSLFTVSDDLLYDINDVILITFNDDINDIYNDIIESVTYIEMMSSHTSIILTNCPILQTSHSRTGWSDIWRADSGRYLQNGRRGEQIKHLQISLLHGQTAC